MHLLFQTKQARWESVDTFTELWPIILNSVMFFTEIRSIGNHVFCAMNRFCRHCVDSWYGHSWSTGYLGGQRFSTVHHLISDMLLSSSRILFHRSVWMLFIVSPFKVLTIFFFTEVLQKAYYRNVAKLQEVRFRQRCWYRISVMFSFLSRLIERQRQCSHPCRETWTTYVRIRLWFSRQTGYVQIDTADLCRFLSRICFQLIAMFTDLTVIWDRTTTAYRISP